MARVTLETAGEDVTVGGSDVEVIGTASGGEEITIVAGSNVTLTNFGGGGDTIMLSGEAEDYTARLEGTRLILTNGSTTVSIPVSDAVNVIEFGGDDERNLTISDDGEVMLGDQMISQDGEDNDLEAGNDEEVTLTEALVEFQDAQTAVEDYLEENETTVAEIEGDVAAAEQAIEDDVDANGTRAQLEASLTSAEADLEAIEDEIAEEEGLAEAIAEFRAAEEASDAADEARDEAMAEYAAAVARYESLNGDTVTGPPAGFAYVGSGNFDLNGADADIDAGTALSDGGGPLIVVEADGDLVLATGVTETTNPGVTALRDALAAAATAAYQADVAADAEAEAGLVAVYTADEQEAIDDFDDLVTAYNTALTAYDNAEAVTPGSATPAQEAALVQAYQALRAGFEATTTPDNVATGANNEVNAGLISGADATTQAEIDDEEAELQAEFDDAEDEALEFVDLEQDLEDAEDDVEAAQDLIDDRDELEADLAAAEETAGELEELQDAVADAEEQIEDLGYEAPVMVDGAETATEESDLFVNVGTDGTIFDFGEEGEDTLFIGEGFAVVELEDDDDLTDDSFGDVGEFEIFMQQDGDDTVLYIEDETFAGNEGDGSFSGTIIRLDDVDMEDVTISEGGFVSIEDSAMA